MFSWGSTEHDENYKKYAGHPYWDYGFANRQPDPARRAKLMDFKALIGDCYIYCGSSGPVDYRSNCEN
jgi:hypothetical protein